MTARSRRREFPGPHATAYALALVAVVFVVDLNLPLGVAAAVPYTFAVLLALKARRGWVGPAVAALCGVLTVAKMGIAPERGSTEMWKVVVNRCLALFAVGMTTVLGVLRQRAEAERRQAEETTRAHLADLAHLSRQRTAGQLATGLAHELNQPLAAVGLQADVAAQLAGRDDPVAREELRGALREIAEQSQRAADIVRTLRRMVGRTDPSQEPVDVNDVVGAVARLTDWQARRAAVDVRLDLAADLPPVLGDRSQLEQVVFNLLQNALDAVLAADDGPRAITVATAAGAAGRVTVAVRDTGVGLGAGDPARVFERFYTTKPSGMGMGLAISRSIVEAHGGRLWAAPQPDRGATFGFALPAADERGHRGA